MRKPPAVSLSSMPRPEYSSASAATTARTCCTLGRALSSKSRVSSATGSGAPAASSAASMTFLRYDSLIWDPLRRAVRGGRRPRAPQRGRRPRASRARGSPHALVFLTPPPQLRARVLLGPLLARRPRQEHPRLDLRQRGGHHQVLPRELQLQLLHQLDVLHVLARDLRERDVEDVEV